MSSIPVFDFDGVLCDSHDETLLVAWLSLRADSRQGFCARTLASIPDDDRHTFLRCRTHASHIGHLRLCFDERLRDVRTQREFDALYQALPSADIERFVLRFDAARRSARERSAASWLAAQRLYPGVAPLLRSLPWGFYVVTAKDTESVLQILGHQEVTVDRAQVLGGCHSKLDAYAHCARQQRARDREVAIVDDHVPNVIAARDGGHHAVWADWGYHTEEHAALAHAQQLPRLTLQALTSRSAAQVA